MSKQANVTVIGAFVVVGVALAVGALVVFGSGAFFKESVKYVAYFSGSVKGLRVGAPVNFRGARVGTVTDISLVFRDSDDTILIPVTFELVKGSVTPLDENSSTAELDDSGHNQLVRRLVVERGLRAQLAMESFVTGQLFIDLDFRPEASLEKVGIRNSFPEIPTIPSSFEKLSRTLEEIPFDEIAAGVSDIVKGVQKIIDDDNTGKAVISLREFLEEAETLVANINKKFPKIDAEISKIALQLEQVLEETHSTVKAYGALVEEGSPIEYELREALREVRAASRSLRNFADYIERHPEAMLRGKE